MRLVCDQDMCAGCMACLEVCAVNAIHIQQNIAAYNAVIDENKCVSCGKCHRICQKNSHPIMLKPEKWYQGWSKDLEQRLNSSSGGVAAEIAKQFIGEGGEVCSCLLENGEFIFKSVSNISDVKYFNGSKYVKSNPIGIYKKIKRKLDNGVKVLFIGLPCQVAALLNYIGDDKSENLITVDLICHGTPSLNVLNMYLKEKKLDLKYLIDFKFRYLSNYKLFKNGEEIVPGIQDNYTSAFLSSLIYTENCYHCDYAKITRVSDITIGDSWGSDLEIEEVEKGISLILCQTKKGIDLINSSNIELFSVDLEKAKLANKQLNFPADKPKKREILMNKIENGWSFNKTMFYMYPKKEFKKLIKKFLIKMKSKK